MYVAESHTDVTDPALVGRISVFNKNGKFLRIDRQGRYRTGRVPNSSRARIRFEGPADCC